MMFGKRLIQLVVFCFVLLLGGCDLEELTNKKDVDVLDLLIKHEWEGIGEQIDGVRWKVKLKHDKYLGIVVSYPDLNCTGGLDYVPAPSSKKNAYFEESIWVGQETCMDGLRVVITNINDTYLRYDVIYGAMALSPFNNGLVDSGDFSGFNQNLRKIARGKLVKESIESGEFYKTNGWIVERDMQIGALGNSYAHNNGKGMLLDFYVDNNGDQNKSMIKIYKQEKIQKGSLDKYKLFMDIDDVYGDSEGHILMAGYNSSGVGGTFACFFDDDLTELGCVAWTDHANRFVLFHGSFEYGFNDLFYATELNPVMRRGTPHQKFVLDVNLEEEIKNKSSLLYRIRDEVAYIRYGAFVSEASIDNQCYKCSAGVNLVEMKLYTE